MHAAGEVGADEGIPRADEPLFARVVAQADLDPAVVVGEARLHAVEVIARGVGGEEGFDLSEKCIGALQGAAGRKIEVEIERRLAGAAAHAAGGHPDFALREGEGPHRGDDDEERLDAVIEHPVERGDVAFAHPDDSAELGVLGPAREALGGKGHEDQGDQERGEERSDDGKTEAEHPKRKIAAALHQNQRQKYDDGGEGGHHDGEADLAGADDGGLRGVGALLPEAIDIFDDDDGVIHDHADGEEEAHHGGHVERPAGKKQDDDRTEERERNGERKDRGHARRAQEQVDDERGEDAAPKAGLGEVVDGLLHLHSLVEENIEINALELREFWQLEERGADLAANALDVAGGIASNLDADGGLAVDAVDIFAARRAEAHEGDVAETEAALVVDDDGGDVFEGVKAAHRADVDFATAVDHVAAGDGEVLVAQRAEHGAHVDPMATETVVEEFDLHLADRSAVDVDVAHAFDALERRLDEIFQTVSRVVDGGRDGRDDVHHGRVGLRVAADIDAVDVGGQERFYAVHAVRDQGVGLAQAGAGLEFDADGRGAVAGVAREALDVGDRAKDVLDLAGNFFLYVARGSVGVTRGDVELVALIALGEEGERDAVEGDEADDENRREDH